MAAKGYKQPQKDHYFVQQVERYIIGEEKKKKEVFLFVAEEIIND